MPSLDYNRNVINLQLNYIGVFKRFYNRILFEYKYYYFRVGIVMRSFSKTNFIFFFVFIIVSGTTSLLYYINVSKIDYINLSKKSLKQEAIALFNNMVHTRSWNAEHGGVYVIAKGSEKPNKYLKDNYTYTKDGDLLIKINPAWMTRQISEIANKNSEYKYKITSLNPINPGNKPDEFEIEALRFFESNKNMRYYTKFSNENFNFMGSLEIKGSCLECHVNQGYKLGDIRGGLRVSIPIYNYNQKIALIKSSNLYITLIVVFIAIIVLIIGIYFINSIYRRQKNIEKLNMVLEKKVKQRTKELEQNVQKLHEMATMDFLTQVPNRRYFFDLSNKLFSLAKRDKTELSLLMIDIDFFKKINDEHGHFVGDEVLKLVSKKIQTNIRTSDILARVGGEEFVVLLNETGKEGATTIAEKLRQIVENTTFTYGNEKIKVTISIGISVLSFLSDETIDDILHRADEALYISKHSGRNKVTFKEV